MNEIERQAQRELDRDILAYVREMQQHAPVTIESIHAFETATRRRRVRLDQVRDRVDYLASAGYLKAITEWEGGEIVHFRITADGIDFLDGEAPPRNWKPRGSG